MTIFEYYNAMNTEATDTWRPTFSCQPPASSETCCELVTGVISGIKLHIINKTSVTSATNQDYLASFRQKLKTFLFRTTAPLLQRRLSCELFLFQVSTLNFCFSH